MRPAATGPAPAAPPLSRSRTWRATALSGVALLVLVSGHMIAHHFVVEEVGGLRTYRQVLAYLSHPAIVVSESLFLVIVTIHAMLGLRSVLFDLGLAERTKRIVSRGLVALGTVTVIYGGVLIATLASRA